MCICQGLIFHTDKIWPTNIYYASIPGMKGLAKGEASTLLNPVLTFYCRVGEFLTDPYAASFTITEIRDPGTAAVAKVTSTAVHLVNDKIGTGRFVIKTGDTATWNYGTHRALVSYQLVSGGRTYYQEILFEVLDPADFPTGQYYTGYVSTRQMYADGLYTFAGRAPQSLHRRIHRASVQVEGWTQRIFEPRYLGVQVNVEEQSKLFLDEAIIAIDQAYTVSRTTSGAEELSAIDRGAYKVLNRHMDGVLNPDDRFNPQLLVHPSISSVEVSNSYLWPLGRLNAVIQGVFGFIDPEPNAGTTLIGRTPEDIVVVVSALVDRSISDPGLNSPSVQSPGSVRSYRTRDQSISFFGDATRSLGNGGWTGDSTLDQLLARFVKPAHADYIDRDPYDSAWI